MKFSGKRPILISTVIAVAVAASLGTFLLLSKSQEQRNEHAHLVSSNAVSPSARVFEGVEAANYDVKDLYAGVVHKCPADDLSCFLSALGTITEKNGPRASLGVLHTLQEQGVISPADDDHHFAHGIGQKTAERFGVNGRAFLLCPTSFNYGCQHGFFQYALGQAKGTDSAAHLICGSLDQSYSLKFIFYCYHGVGHGVLMAKNYDLANALAACDTLKTHNGQDGCWQGVFMENVNAGRKDSSSRQGFSRTDPLAPCNVVAEKYRQECFINHAGWLMKFFENNVTDAASACVKAPGPHVSTCLQSIGLMVTNPAWQPSLGSHRDGKNHEVIAWNLCRKFPRGHRESCVIGAIDNILNFDELEVSRAKTFCNTVDAAYRKICYQRVGFSLRNQATDTKLVRGKCVTLEGADAAACLQGSGLEMPSRTALVGPIHSIHGSLSAGASEAPQAAEDDIFNNDEALDAYVRRHGLLQTVTRLHTLGLAGGDCHVPAHKAGRFAYSIFSMEAFNSIPGECHAGGFHGAVEAYFMERGTIHLADDVRLICRSELNQFYSHQCVHGIGHGLMAASNHELLEALEKCDALNEKMQHSCWSGVFMENIVGGLGGHEGHGAHRAKYLNDDPHYPCTMVAEKYKSACYFFQPSRMMQLFNADFRRIGSACANAPAQFQNSCFESMGREVSGVYRGRAAGAIQSCTHAPKGAARISCLTGAVQDSFWDSAGQDPALTFCALLNAKAEKDACYETIFNRAPQILPTMREIQDFCAKAESSYRTSCLKKKI
jgi:hypothetical protein